MAEDFKAPRLRTLTPFERKYVFPAFLFIEDRRWLRWLVLAAWAAWHVRCAVQYTVTPLDALVVFLLWVNGWAMAYTSGFSRGERYGRVEATDCALKILDEMAASKLIIEVAPVEPMH